MVFVPNRDDFATIQNEHWYRIPQKYAPKGLYAEYFAFYFGSAFGSEKWAIHYYAPRLGHELVTRQALFPDQPNHPRVNWLYYKVQLGPVVRLKRPIISMRLRRVTFIHTTWDRFQDAVEINDLHVTGGHYVDRLFATLKERGLAVEHGYRSSEEGEHGDGLTVLCENGRIPIPIYTIPKTENGIQRLAAKVQKMAEAQEKK
ncbi:MAG: hypothetical protein Kow0080_04730 [Candidatus Promineifilaceae bacterium]